MNAFQAPRRQWLTALLASSLAGLAHGQSRYPDHPITLVVPFGPGGIADVTARAVAEHMAKTLGQPVVVDNRPSAGSIVATQTVASAKPDGYTLLLMSNGNAVSAGLFKKLPFDVQRDFAFISTLGYFDLGVFAPAQSRFATLAAAVAYGRSNPGKLTIATISAGSTQHLAAELFKTQAGLDAVVVPYKGTPAVITALRAGEVDLAFEILGPSLVQVQAGAVRALAVTGEQRHRSLPDVPTVAQAGVARYTVASWNGLAAPAGTPPEVLARLGTAANEALKSPGVQERLQHFDVRAQGSTPEQMRSLLASEIKRWGDVIRAAKIELQ